MRNYAYATKDDLKTLGKDLEGKIDKAVEDLSGVIGDLAKSMHGEVTGLHNEVSGLNVKMITMQSDITELKGENKEIKATLDQLMKSIDKFVGRIDTYETEQKARDAQFARLLAWARKVSKKTGIPLENL